MNQKTDLKAVSVEWYWDTDNAGCAWIFSEEDAKAGLDPWLYINGIVKKSDTRYELHYASTSIMSVDNNYTIYVE